MELEERKIIITHTTKKKKEDRESEKEIKLQKQAKAETEAHAIEVAKVTTPLIKAERSKLNLKNFDTQRPEIQKVRVEKIRPVRLPPVKLSLKNLRITRAEAELCDKSKSSFQQISLPPIRLSLKNLNTKYSITADSKSSDSIRIPKLQRRTLQLKHITQDEQRRQSIRIETKTLAESTKKLEPKPVDVKVVEVQATRIVEEEEFRAKEYEEIPDFIEILLGKGRSKILSGKPLCVIVERHPDKYEFIVATICREIYREKKGRSPPQPIPVRTVDDFDLMYRADISNQIILVEEAKYSETLKKVLSKLPFSNLGFLILVTDKPEELEQMVPTAEEFLIKVEPIDIDENLKVRIVELVKGSELIKSYNLGEDFINATDEFENILREYLEYSKAPDELKEVWDKLMAKSPEDLEQASEEHSAMKSFVWQYLWKRYKKVPRLEDERGVDVSIDNENYEIETFYGCGDPIAKLTEKMKKFSQGEKVFFVLRNISILMHLKDLISFKKTWANKNYNVEIFGIDFKNRELIPIEEFAKGGS